MLSSLSGLLLPVPGVPVTVHFGMPGPSLSPLFLLPSTWPEPQGEELSQNISQTYPPTPPTPLWGCLSGNEGIAQGLGWGLFKLFCVGFGRAGTLILLGLVGGGEKNLGHKVLVCLVLTVSWSIPP